MHLPHYTAKKTTIFRSKPASNSSDPISNFRYWKAPKSQFYTIPLLLLSLHLSFQLPPRADNGALLFPRWWDKVNPVISGDPHNLRTDPWETFCCLDVDTTLPNTNSTILKFKMHFLYPHICHFFLNTDFIIGLTILTPTMWTLFQSRICKKIERFVKLCVDMCKYIISTSMCISQTYSHQYV